MGRVNGSWMDVTNLEDGKPRLRWVLRSVDERPAMPTPPPTRIILVGRGPACAKCGSTMMRRKWLLFGKRPGCIQPDCLNYGGVRPAGRNGPPTFPKPPAPPAPPSAPFTGCGIDPETCVQVAKAVAAHTRRTANRGMS